MSPFVAALLSAIVISLLSVVGFLLYSLPRSFSRHLVPILVSFAVGSLLGDAFLHLIPDLTVSPLFILVGIVFFYTLERLIHLHHCHDLDCSDKNHSLIAVSIIGDTLHNFVDGLTLASAFLVSPNLGFATTIAIISHEIPQEVGDVSLFLHSGFRFSRALTFNLISALFSLLGVVFVFVFPLAINISAYVLPFAAGNFIYLALSDLLPVLHRQSTKVQHLPSQLIPLTLGIILMYFLTFFA